MKSLLLLWLGWLALAGNYETVLSKADLQEIEVRSRKATTIPDFWQTKAGHIVRCENGHCSVSCEAQPEMDAPEKNVEKAKGGCWLGLRPIHLKTYQALIDKAGQTKSPQTDPEKITTCDAARC